jgi:hypothetical protein
MFGSYQILCMQHTCSSLGMSYIYGGAIYVGAGFRGRSAAHPYNSVHGAARVKRKYIVMSLTKWWTYTETKLQLLLY